MRKRKGLLLLWVQIASCFLLLLAGAVLALSSAAIRAEERAEKAADRALLAEETMETLKYNERFRETLPIPDEAERNGRRYEVKTKRAAVSAAGISCAAATVSVTGEDGETTSFSALLGPALPEEAP